MDISRKTLYWSGRGGARTFLLLLLIAVMATTRVQSGGDDGEAMSARWFYEKGVALQVADSAGPESCLRSFQVSALTL